MREKVAPWLPAISCAVLSAITILGNLYVMVVNKTNWTDINIVFYCFLPMCFFYVGAFLVHLQKENRELRAQLEQR